MMKLQLKPTPIFCRLWNGRQMYPLVKTIEKDTVRYGRHYKASETPLVLRPYRSVMQSGYQEVYQIRMPYVLIHGKRAL